MSSRTFATRMTCFSLVSAIETDVRRLLSNMNAVTQLDVPTDVRSNAESRYLSHFGEKIDPNAPLIDLIEFSDFSDLSKILNKNRNTQTLVESSTIQIIASNLDSLVGARNRVCHSRPLE